MFRLPAYEDLSREQDTIFNLPLDGHHLVIGPPGTGKTVLAVYRAEMYTRAESSTRFVVYNNTLDQYLSYSKHEREITGSTSTLNKWFYWWYRRKFGKTAPQLQPYVFDWQKILSNMMQLGRRFEKVDSIIVDEGQDFPRYFYLVLRELACNITVFADENQRITENHSTVSEIRNCLGVNDTYTLTRNYRNTEQIARVAQHFYADLDSGVPDLPERQGPKPKLYLNCPVNRQIARIANYASNNRHQTVGVFLNTKKQQEMFTSQLRHATDVPVETYISTSCNNRVLNFAKKGIKVLNYRSAKGLEFDAVFLPELQELRTDTDEDMQKMQFFVLISRARSQLWMLTRGGEEPHFMRDLRGDLYDIV